MPEPVLLTEPDSPPLLAQAPRIASGTALPGPGASTAQPPITPPKPATVPNARKGYKLTLWVSATTDAGVSDVNGGDRREMRAEERRATPAMWSSFGGGSRLCWVGQRVKGTPAQTGREKGAPFTLRVFP